jgi:hypothetical protein
MSARRFGLPWFEPDEAYHYLWKRPVAWVSGSGVSQVCAQLGRAGRAVTS